MIEPLQLLRSALRSEYGDKPRIGALATVDEEGRPRVRSVVLRRTDDAGVFWITTDRRSAKSAHLTRNPAAEIVFWLPARREQFRVAGEVSLHQEKNEPIVRELWQELSPASRAMFYWPAPGAPRAADASFATSTPSHADLGAVPETFQVLGLRPLTIEFLDLNPQPHVRRRWNAETAWHSEELNP